MSKKIKTFNLVQDEINERIFDALKDENDDKNKKKKKK